jgi:hypothetical protein
MKTMDFSFRFPSGFELANRLLIISERSLDIPEGEKLRYLLMQYQLKCHRLLAASILLLKSGYAVETQSHCRTIQETLINIKYLLLNPDRHEQMILDYRPFERWKDLREHATALKLYYENIGSLTFSKEAKTSAKKDYEEAKRQFEDSRKQYDAAEMKRKQWEKLLREEGVLKQGEKPAHTWSLKPLWFMAEKADLLFIYHYTYRHFSAFVHPSLNPGAKYVVKRTGGLMVSPSQLGMKRQLLAVCMFHHMMTSSIAEFYKIQPVIDELNALEQEQSNIRNSSEFNEEDPLFGKD